MTVTEWAISDTRGVCLSESFDAAVSRLFRTEFGRLFRYLDRVSGDPDLAKDLAQEAFVRLLQRRAMPDFPVAWLVTVANNLRRNAGAKASRRRQLLTVDRGEQAQSDPTPAPDQVVLAAEDRQRVRRVLDRMPAREAQMLVLQAEGYSYREIAAALKLQPASIGTLLARARAGFLAGMDWSDDASR